MRLLILLAMSFLLDVPVLNNAPVMAPVMADQTGYRAWIETRPEGSGVRVLPYAETPSAATVRFELLVTKYHDTATGQGKDGTSTTRQAGTVQTSASIPQMLSNLFLDFSDGDRYTLSIKLYDSNGTLLAEDTVQRP